MRFINILHEITNKKIIWDQFHQKSINSKAQCYDFGSTYYIVPLRERGRERKRSEKIYKHSHHIIQHKDNGKKMYNVIELQKSGHLTYPMKM